MEARARSIAFCSVAKNSDRCSAAVRICSEDTVDFNVKSGIV